LRAPVDRIDFANRKSRIIIHAAISAAFTLTELGDAKAAHFHRIVLGAMTFPDVEVRRELLEVLLEAAHDGSTNPCERRQFRWDERDLEAHGQTTAFIVNLGLFAWAPCDMDVGALEEETCWTLPAVHHCSCSTWPWPVRP
jgi:hypothetical protein